MRSRVDSGSLEEVCQNPVRRWLNLSVDLSKVFRAGRVGSKTNAFEARVSQQILLVTDSRTPVRKCSMPDRRERARMDFVFTVISADDESQTLRVVLEPDPGRYEWRTLEGKRYLYDKLDDVYIPDEVYSQLAGQMNGQPLFCQQPKIADVKAYFQSRKAAITTRLDGHFSAPRFEDKSEEFLESLSVYKLGFVIISIDIVGSTRLATSLSPEEYAKVTSTIVSELSEVVPVFHGHVLTYTGDGLLAYFPEPSFISKNDLAIDCALTLHSLVYNVLNPILRERGFPEIGVRIGIDAGDACIVSMGSSETKCHKDIIGLVVNLAVKIQARAKPGEILLGGTVERNLHGKWRALCEAIHPGNDWEYRYVDGDLYTIYRLRH